MSASLCVSVPPHPGMQDRQMVPVQDPSPPNFSKSLLYLLLSACANTDRGTWPRAGGGCWQAVRVPAVTGGWVCGEGGKREVLCFVSEWEK